MVKGVWWDVGKLGAQTIYMFTSAINKTNRLNNWGESLKTETKKGTFGHFILNKFIFGQNLESLLRFLSQIFSGMQ